MRRIRFRYRKVIDQHTKDEWSRMVWEDSYSEFKIQFQLYNPEKKYFSFGQLLDYNPQSEHLHFLVGGSVMNYIVTLKGKFPEIVDNAGHRCLTIGQCRFEIINSDIRNIHQHQVAFNFYSPEILLHEVIGNHLLVSEVLPQGTGAFATHLVPLVPYLTMDRIRYDELL